MSEQDQNILVGRITKKLLWSIIPMFVVFMLLEGFTTIRANKKKADESFVEMHYSQLYRMNAEMNTMLKDYIRADEREKDRIWDEIEKIANRMDLYVMKPEVMRGVQNYGKEFTPLN